MTKDLERILSLWDLTEAEAALLFGAQPETLSEWRRTGLPPKAGAIAAELAALSDTLESRLTRDRIPVVVRRPVPSCGGQSLLDLACAGRLRDLSTAVTAMFDLRRVQP